MGYYNLFCWGLSSGKLQSTSLRSKTIVGKKERLLELWFYFLYCKRLSRNISYGRYLLTSRLGQAHSHFVWTGVAINGCISWLCETFYIRRCWKMTDHNPWVLYPLGTLSVTVFIANLIQAVSLPLVVNKTDPESGNYLGSGPLMSLLQFVFSYWIFGSLVLDLIVASILITTLWRAKTGLEDSDRVVWSVITLTCESASLPCISMIAAVSLYHSTKESNLVLFFVLLAGKLYSYGLLRTLNSRDGFRLRLNSHNLGRATLSNWQWDQGRGDDHPHLETAVASISEPPKSLDTTSATPHVYEAVL
ncbi:hypothetical protein LENED_006885 [Lentinula edodes]|uniref:DUF6534 domain-containing protein n=1 Tax=Lentinula edodes TaxID=5353 RepID=A0A1Q3ED43_LENED|nr:hypothetical protein LENED_006885 [Lentinula edodes]